MGLAAPLMTTFTTAGAAPMQQYIQAAAQHISMIRIYVGLVFASFVLNKHIIHFFKRIIHPGRGFIICSLRLPS